MCERTNCPSPLCYKRFYLYKNKRFTKLKKNYTFSK